jgi:23S rRNA maturation mini-RNase III
VYNFTTEEEEEREKRGRNGKIILFEKRIKPRTAKMRTTEN